ncbi:PorT family protein [Tannerella sp. AM09-19]|nr:PorT family protein [Tannerella sp. AM09-19]
MNNKDFEHLIQEKLKDHETEVPVGLWESIEKELPRKKVFSLPVFIRYAAACIIVAVCSVTAYLFLEQSDKIQIVQNRHSAIPQQQPPKTEEPNIQEAKVSLPHKPLITQSKTTTEKEKNVQKELSENVVINEFITQQPNNQGKEEKLSKTFLSVVKKANNEQKRHPDNISEEEYNRKLKEFEQAGQKEVLTETNFNSQKRNGFSLGLLAANALPGSKNTNNQPLTRSSSIMGDELSLFSTPEPLKFTHKTPISVGLTIEKHLGKHWGVESGIVYTLLRSDYKTQSLSQEGKQELHYIGIPLQAIYRFARAGNFSFYAAAGPKIDFNVSGRRTETARNGIASSNGTEDIRDKKPQWSLQLRAGAAYAFIPQLELYAEPSMAYYINNKSDIPDLWKDKPLNFIFQVGLRTNF